MCQNTAEFLSWGECIIMCWSGGSMSCIRGVPKTFFFTICCTGGRRAKDTEEVQYFGPGNRAKLEPGTTSVQC